MTTQSIVAEYDLPHSVAKVWRALTEPKLVSAWLMTTDISAEVGHKFTFQAQPMGDWDGVVRCEVLEVIPGKRFRYSWVGGKNIPDKYVTALDSVVDWTLTPTTTGGTLLRLEHSGFTAANAMAYEMMGKGWRGHVRERMETLLSEMLG